MDSEVDMFAKSRPMDVRYARIPREGFEQARQCMDK